MNGNCFALAGMHLISKLIDKWIWATFEPQNSITNPSRCKVLGCYDLFGSQPARSSGADTQLTPELAALMDAASLAPEWRNYRLDAVQIDFFAPKLLGNSIIEGENVGMNLKQASCVSCHAVSSVKKSGAEGINLLAAMANPPVGLPKPLPSDAWIRRDFVWSLGLACPNGPPARTRRARYRPVLTRRIGELAFKSGAVRLNRCEAVGVISPRQVGKKRPHNPAIVGRERNCQGDEPA